MAEGTGSHGELPLAGALVLDLADECLLLTGRLLADLGATVLRIESSSGDETRRRAPFVDGHEGLERSLAHLRYNGGKLSAALNFAAPEAWEAIERLTGAADLVLAPLEKHGPAAAYLDHARFGAAHPRAGLIDVVYQRGNPALRPSDLAAVASGGMLYCNGYPDRAPDYPVGKLAYKQAAINGAAAATALLLDARRQGQGGIATVSLEEAMVSTLIQAANQNLWKWYSAVGKRAGMGGLTYPVLNAAGGVALVPGSSATFEAADRKWVVFGMTPFTMQRWIAFVQWLEEMTGDDALGGEEWHDADYRSEHRVRVEAAMRALCGSLPRDQLANEGQARGLMVVPVNSVGDIAADEHLRIRGVFPDIAQPGVGRKVPGLRSPFRSTAWEPRTATAPLLGQHTRWALEVIAGYGKQHVDRLASLGVAHDSTAAGGAPAPSWAAPSAPAAPAALGDPKALPLAGYRVIDFCWQAAGPLTTEVLANLGADVIKIESMKRVDTVRLFMHPMEHFSIDTGAFFNDCNTGKRSITLNLSTDEGRDIVRRLISGADVVSSNFTPGQMEHWGFGYEELCAVKPDVVVLTLPVMGENGPKRGWRGIGNSVVAMSGLAWHTGFPDRPPAGLGPLQTDFTVPLFGASAIISALLQRERTGRGQHIEISQYESGLQLLDTELMDCLINDVVPERRGNRSAEASPHGVYPCAGDDRWVALEIRSLDDWQQFCRVIGRLDLSEREDLRTLDGRRAAQDDIDAAIEEWSRVRPPEEAERLLQSGGVIAAALKHVGDLVEHTPGLAEFFTTVNHPAGLPLMIQNQPFTWNGRRLAISRGPLLGEHNEPVLRGELGIDEETFVQLMVDEVVI